MPNVSITMVAGRPPEKKEDLIKKVTDAVVDALGVSKESVHIALYEIPKETSATEESLSPRKNPSREGW